MSRAPEAPIPFDDAAEEAVVGLALQSPARARAVGSRLRPEDFYRPGLGRALEAACQLEAERSESRRIAVVASVAALPEGDLGRIAAAAVGPVERWVIRVRSASRRRRVMAAGAAIYNGAAADDPATILGAARSVVHECEYLIAEAAEAPQAKPVEPGGLALGAFRSHQRGDRR